MEIVAKNTGYVYINDTVTYLALSENVLWNVVKYFSRVSSICDNGELTRQHIRKVASPPT